MFWLKKKGTRKYIWLFDGFVNCLLIEILFYDRWLLCKFSVDCESNGNDYDNDDLFSGNCFSLRKYCVFFLI